MNEKLADIDIDHLLEILRWAWRNQGQRYRLRKALVEWLKTNDDGTLQLPDLAYKFVQEIDVDAVVERPKPSITECYIFWKRPGVAHIAVFRGNSQQPDLDIETTSLHVQGLAIRLNRLIHEIQEQPVRVQYLDIYGAVRVWVDGIRGELEHLKEQAEAKLVFYIAEKAPDGDIEKALEEDRLPNRYEQFRREIVVLEDLEGLVVK